MPVLGPQLSFAPHLSRSKPLRGDSTYLGMGEKELFLVLVLFVEWWHSWGLTKGRFLVTELLADHAGLAWFDGVAYAAFVAAVFVALFAYRARAVRRERRERASQYRLDLYRVAEATARARAREWDR